MNLSNVAHKIEPALALLIVAQSLTGIGGIKAADALRVLDEVAKRLSDPKAMASSVDAQAHIDRLRAAFAADDAAADALVTG